MVAKINKIVTIVAPCVGRVKFDTVFPADLIDLYLAVGSATRQSYP
jgi:hypothetical protein